LNLQAMSFATCRRVNPEFKFLDDRKTSPKSKNLEVQSKITCCRVGSYGLKPPQSKLELAAAPSGWNEWSALSCCNNKVAYFGIR